MPKLTDEITVTMTKEEALVLLSGAVKGNVVYGSVASRDGQTTLRLCEKFANEFGIIPFPSDPEPATPPIATGPVPRKVWIAKKVGPWKD